MFMCFCCCFFDMSAAGRLARRAAAAGAPNGKVMMEIMQFRENLSERKKWLSNIRFLKI